MSKDGHADGGRNSKRHEPDREIGQIGPFQLVKRVTGPDSDCHDRGTGDKQEHLPTGDAVGAFEAAHDGNGGAGDAARIRGESDQTDQVEQIRQFRDPHRISDGGSRFDTQGIGDDDHRDGPAGNAWEPTPLVRGQPPVRKQKGQVDCE